MSGVRFSFRYGLWRAYDFLYGGFFFWIFGKAVPGIGVFLMKLGFLFFDLILIVFFVFVEDRATGSRVCLGFFAQEILLGVDQTSREDVGFLIADGRLDGVRNFSFRIDVGGRGSANLLCLYALIGRPAGL